MIRSQTIRRTIVQSINRTTISKRFIMSKSEEEWRAILSPQQFRVLRESGTETPYSGEYTKTPATAQGVYECVGCHQPLYKSSSKFIAHCGWPAFYEAIPGSITVNRDTSHGMVREEMRCSNCNGHLGHIFKGEGYDTPTDARHCVNSISLKFNPK
ncbi:hypothetical protein DFJ63DRAFT_287439 [Scheffersomyces coipomensis]|uniref:uncharacterized protein n=1 Tax=Scheffersomyces coipomensis TaxID=1788519 RepID=UPI00315C78F9